MGHDRERAEPVAGDLVGLAVPADVLRREDLVAAGGRVLDEWGWVDILVNAACGNMAGAGQVRFGFRQCPKTHREVVDLTLVGTLLPSQVFGAAMTSGAIVHVSSMAATRVITRVAGPCGSTAHCCGPDQVLGIRPPLGWVISAE